MKSYHVAFIYGVIFKQTSSWFFLIYIMYAFILWTTCQTVLMKFVVSIKVKTILERVNFTYIFVNLNHNSHIRYQCKKKNLKNNKPNLDKPLIISTLSNQSTVRILIIIKCTLFFVVDIPNICNCLDVSRFIAKNNKW